MAILKGSAVDGFIRRPPGETVCALVYGGDGGAVRETVEAIVRAAAGSLDDPFAVARLDERQMAQDAARLADEAAALPLLGGRRVVWVTDPGPYLIKALEAVLGAGGAGNLIVIEGGDLARTSRLRIICEPSPRAVVIPLYADTERDLGGLLSQELKSANLVIADEARQRVLSLLGGGRSDSRQQLSKLVSYCLGEREVSLAAVEACCGDSSELSPDDLLDAALDGDIEETDRQLARAAEGGLKGAGMLSSASYHIARLQRLRLEIDRRRSVHEVVKSARPPIYYARQPAVIRQLQSFDGDQLAGIMATVALAIRHTREWSALEDSIATRAFLSLARLARSRKLERV